MGIISGSVSFRGRFGDRFRVGDHFGVGIISGTVQTWALPFSLTQTVVATICSEALGHDRCIIFPGLSYNKANNTLLNSLRNNDVEAEVEFTLKL